MHIKIDTEGDLFYAQWGDTQGAKSREIDPGVYMLYKDGEPVALEVLFLHRRPGFAEGLNLEIPQAAANS